jgi:hypothetical protein
MAGLALARRSLPVRDGRMGKPLAPVLGCEGLLAVVGQGVAACGRRTSSV